MKIQAILLISSFLFTITHCLQTFYISNATTCSFSACDGSISNPFPGLISGLNSAIQQANSLADFSIDIELLSDYYIIKDLDLSVLANNPQITRYNGTYQLFERNITINQTKSFDFIRIKPANCDPDPNIYCNINAIINLKTENFSFTVANITVIRNLIFQGQNLIFRHQKILNPSIANSINTSCLESNSVDCCNLSQMSDNTSNCYIVGLDDSQRQFERLQDYQYGLFQHKQDNTTLNVSDCEFSLIIAIGLTSVETYNYIFGSFINPLVKYNAQNVVVENLMGLSLYLSNSRFSGNYLVFGEVSYTNNNANGTIILINNCSFEDYNAFIIKDLSSYYNNFDIIISNATQITFINNNIKNCFKTIFLDYSNVMFMKNNTFLYNNDLQLQNITIITTNINIINGHNDNFYIILNNSITILLRIPYSEALFQAQNNNTLILKDHTFANISNCSLLSYQYYCSVIMENIILTDTVTYNSGFITFTFQNSLNITNSSFNNLNVSIGDMIFFSNSSMVFINNLTVFNNIIRTTGSFLRCDVWNCTVLMNNASFSNITTNTDPAIFYLGSSCVITINLSNFINITTASQGGLLYGNVWHYLTFMNLIIDTINAQEGAILYIKDNNILNMTNVTTNNSAANIAFLYYGRESQNTIIVSQSNFLNSQGTAVAQLMAGSILIIDCLFNNLTNNGQQASIVYGGASTPVIFTQNQIFNINMDPQGVGLIFLLSGCLTNISNSLFEDINANLGSIVYASQGNTVNISNITLNNFIADNEGALSFESNNIASIKSSSFNNLTIYTDGGVLSLGSNNNISFTNGTVFNVTVTFFGAFCNADDSNIIYLSHSNISALVSISKGGLFYATSNNIISIKSINLTNIVSEAGPLGAFNTKNTLYLNHSIVSNSMAMRYGGLIYSFTQNILYIYNTSFYSANSQNLAGGFYMDIFNSLFIDNSSFFDFSAMESGALFVTIYQNNIIVNNSQFQSIWLNSSNDGVIASLGLSTNTNITYSLFSQIYSDLTNNVFLLSDYNNFSIDNSNFTQIQLASSSGFLQAGTGNIMSFNAIYIDFYKDIYNVSIIGSGELFFLLANNTLSQFSNSLLRVCHFAVLFDLEANCVGILTDLKLTNDSLFDNFFTVKNNSLLQVSSLKTKVSSQTITITDSQLSLSKISIILENAQFSSLLTLSNSQLNLKNCEFLVRDSISTGSFLIAEAGSKIQISRSSFIGFRGQLAGVFTAMDCDQFLITSSILLFNQAGSNGGGLAYQTTINTIYAENRRRILQSNPNDNQYNRQLLKFINTISVGNSASQGFGGGVYIENANNDVVDMQIGIMRNRFIFNKANQGGAVFIDQARILQVNECEFTSNQALLLVSMQIDGIRAQGGAIYYNSIDNNGQFLNVKSSYYANKAEIGGALYLSPLDLSYNWENCDFLSNSMIYYGSDLAGPVYRISFNPNISTSIIYNDFISNFSIENIQSGNQYSDCLGEIIGIDKYGNIALNTLDDFYNSVSFIEYSKTSTAILMDIIQEGAICLNGFLRTGLPIQGATKFNISFQRYDGLSDQLNLSLSFRDCQIGEKLTSDYQCQTCPDGTYSLVQTFDYIIDNCKDCIGLDFQCQPGGIYTPNAGFWRYGNFSSNFMTCPKELNCLGGFLIYNGSSLNADILNIFGNTAQDGNEVISETGYCKLGYKGVLCNECDSGYGKVNAYTCLPCKSDGYVAWVIFQILFKVLILFASLHISLKTSIGLYMEDISELDVTLTNLIKIMLNHIQMLIVLFTFIDFSQIYDNVISFILGVNTNLGESFNIECLLKTGGWNLSPLYFEFWITVLYIFPIGLICFFYVRLMHRISEKRYNKTMSFWLLYLSCILIVLQLSYFDIINITLKLFPCFNVADEYYPENRLVFDYSIGCNDRTQMIVKYAAGLPIVLVFGLGFPLGLLYVLMKKTKDNTVRTDDSLLAIGFFFYIYEESFFFWDILQLLRKFSMTLIQILLASSLLVQNFASLEVLLIVVFSFLCLQLKLRPYLKPTFDIANKLERTSLVALTLTFYFALYFTGLKLDQGDIIQADIILFLLSLLINLIFLIYWSYVFLPQQLLSTWFKVRDLGKTLINICQKKKENKGDNNGNHVNGSQILSENHDFFHNNRLINDPQSLTVIHLEGPSSSILITEKASEIDTRKSLNMKLEKTESNIFDRTSVISFDSQKGMNRESNSSSKKSNKSIIFQKNIKKDLSSFFPLQQFSLPSIPDIEEENNDLSFISLLNNKQLQGVILKKSFIEFETRKKDGFKPFLLEIQGYNKLNFGDKLTKLAILNNEGKLYNDENCEISFKCNGFVKNSNFMRMECLVLKKKPEISLEEIKIKMNELNSCIEIIEDKEREEKPENKELVLSYIVLFTATHLALADLPSLKIKLNLSRNESSEIHVKIPLSIIKFFEFQEIPSIFNYFRTWNSIFDLEFFELKKIDRSFFENPPYETLQELFPNSLIHEKDKPQAEILGMFKTYLLPKMQILFRIKVIIREKKSLFEKHGVQKKYELKVLMGMKKEQDAPEIFRKNKEFGKYCLNLMFSYMFGMFYGESKRIIQTKLATLMEEDEAMHETATLK